MQAQGKTYRPARSYLCDRCACDLQVASIWHWNKDADVHQQIQHKGVSNARQQQLPCWPCEDLGGGVGVVGLCSMQPLYILRLC